MLWKLRDHILSVKREKLARSKANKMPVIICTLIFNYYKDQVLRGGDLKDDTGTEM